MADKVINSKIQFAYASNNAIVELKREIEKHFLYQNILIVDEKYEYSRMIDKMQHQISCSFKVTRHVDSFAEFEKYACILCINDYSLHKIKSISKKYSIPYIVVLTKVVEPYKLSLNYINDDCKILQTNFPIGIVFDKTEVYNKKQFVCNFLLETFGTSFDEMQDRINNIFFDMPINYEKTTEISNFRSEVKQQMLLKQTSFDNMFDIFSKMYLQLCLKKCDTEISLIDRLGFLYQKTNKNCKNIIKCRYMYRLILNSIIGNFFKFWNIKLKSEIDYQKHIEFLSNSKLNFNFKTNSLPERKLVFLLNEFREKFIFYTQQETTQNNFLKNLLADLDITYLYTIIDGRYEQNIVDLISVEPDVFSTPNILTLMSASGLLNFEI